MNSSFDHDAHEYLLNQMDSARRRAFEGDLERSAEARAALKQQADALAGFACDVAAAESLSPADQRVVLGAIVAVAEERAGTRNRTPLGAWSRFIWAAAALILLGVNLVDFQRPVRPGDGNRAGELDGKTKPAAATPGGADGVTTSSETASKAPPAETTKSGTLADARRETAADASAVELARLRAHVAELEQARDRIRAEYDRLVGRIADQALIERDLNRMATMELVDAGRYARGERRGLVNVGREILTEPGIVAVPDSTTPPDGTSSTVPKQPYAWSVFDEREHRGYLNLYQLPVVSPEETMQVWVRPTEAAAFQRATEVPAAYHGGGGRVQYTMPEATSAPAEILITVEPRGASSTAPTGRTVLRGP